MSFPRVLPMLLAALVLCVSLRAACVLSYDPTEGCYPTSSRPNAGDNQTGNWQSDHGFSQLYGFESYFSDAYNILCSWRGWYGFGPNGLVTTPGPWHGNNKDYPDCGTDSFYNIFNVANDWPVAGSVGVRTNGATGRQVMTGFSFTGICSTNAICAGVCPNSPTASLASDPTYKVYSMGDVAVSPNVPASPMAELTRKLRSAPATNDTPWLIVTNLNTTITVSTPIRSPAQQQYPDKDVSCVTSITVCWGHQYLNCSNTTAATNTRVQRERRNAWKAWTVQQL